MISISEASGSTCTSEKKLDTFQCPHGQALYSVQRILKYKRTSPMSGKTTRIYCYNCQSHNGRVSECYDTGYINQWDLPAVMLCKHNHYIAGVKTSHSEHYVDDRFSFRCCRNAFQCTRNCHLQGPINQLGESTKYNVDGKVIVGALSWHSNEKM